MAVKGPATKPNKHGRTPSLVDWVDVPDVEYDGPSPNLPPLPRRKKWHPLVEQWWEQVRHMPHCVLWQPTDWTAAVETGLMKQAYWSAFENGEEKTTQAVEIRRREDAMGVTAEARRKLRIRYVDPALLVDPDLDDDGAVFEPAAGAPANVTSISERRTRIAG